MGSHSSPVQPVGASSASAKGARVARQYRGVNSKINCL